MQLRCGSRVVSLAAPCVMGVVNVTPDSFSDGGRFLDTGAAVACAIRMVEEGAAIIDVGGESTRPGAPAVPLEEELRRVIPVIEGLVSRTKVPLSIDTMKPAVARAAINAGFGRVFLTLLDTHISALIAAAFLFQFGTGPIRGFAVTLTIGICTSIFASVTVVRLLIFYWLNSMRKSRRTIEVPV